MGIKDWFKRKKQPILEERMVMQALVAAESKIDHNWKLSTEELQNIAREVKNLGTPQEVEDFLLKQGYEPEPEAFQTYLTRIQGEIAQADISIEEGVNSLTKKVEGYIQRLTSEIEETRKALGGSRYFIDIYKEGSQIYKNPDLYISLRDKNIIEEKIVKLHRGDYSRDIEYIKLLTCPNQMWIVTHSSGNLSRVNLYDEIVNYLGIHPNTNSQLHIIKTIQQLEKVYSSFIDYAKKEKEEELQQKQVILERIANFKL